MRFRIEKDLVGGMQGRSYSTHKSKGTPKDEPLPVVLYLYDDDGELYYVIGCSCDEAAEYAFDMIGPGAGVTHSTIAMSRTEKATPFIG
jgi:hypothetical protein